LDDYEEVAPETVKGGAGAGGYGKKIPVRKDSMKRRDALLKGKEGSRRRQRWENGALPLATCNSRCYTYTPRASESHPRDDAIELPSYLV
jgi:hypothetical protein